MPRIYIRFELSGEAMGTTDVLYRYWDVPENYTETQIENGIYESYVDYQLEHYDQYADFNDYCDDWDVDPDEDDGSAYDEYYVHVMEQGSYEVLDHEPTEDDMCDSIWPLESL